PTAPPRYHVPTQLDRADFPHPEAPWLLVVFTSATCDSCRGVLERARPLDGPELAVVEVEVGERPDLHTRYGIDAVPTLVLADTDGVVFTGSLGPVDSLELWAAVADARSARDEGIHPPGSGELGHG
ncbi:MAG: thioredoxin, partial [Actinomyces sp.]